MRLGTSRGEALLEKLLPRRPTGLLLMLLRERVLIGLRLGLLLDDLIGLLLRLLRASLTGLLLMDLLRYTLAELRLMLLLLSLAGLWLTLGLLRGRDLAELLLMLL